MGKGHTVVDWIYSYMAKAEATERSLGATWQLYMDYLFDEGMEAV
jgi:hypothetical protein